MTIVHRDRDTFIWSSHIRVDVKETVNEQKKTEVEKSFETKQKKATCE